MKTPEERGAEIAHWWEWKATEEESEERSHAARIAAALRAYGDERATQKREACARIVETGAGSLEAAIQFGPNAALAAAIRARKDTP